MTWARHAAVPLTLLFLIGAAGCGASDNRVDPGDLRLRDLLGIAPPIAADWNAAQRREARRLLERGLAVDDDGAQERAALGRRGDAEARILAGIAGIDTAREHRGEEPLGLARIAIAATELTAEGIAVDELLADRERDDEPDGDAAMEVAILVSAEWDSEAAVAWGALPGRGLRLLGALARAAGHRGAAPVLVIPAPRYPFAAAYVADPPRLLVNPVLLAALEPADGEAATSARLLSGSADSMEVGARLTPVAPGPAAQPGGGGTAQSGNPYSFYGSTAECAQAHRLRCESCVADGLCARLTPDSVDGISECATLAAEEGRGFFLFCANLALSIDNVAVCADRRAPSCPSAEGAADSLTTLTANANFIDDPLCGTALDACLAEIYGSPDGEYPPPPSDGGLGPDGGGGGPPRDTTATCGESDNNCELSPECDGPQCNGAVSCDGTCSDSPGGCSAGCGSCESDSEPGGGGDGSDCGSCESGGDSTSGGSDCGSSDSDSSSGSCSSDEGSCGSCNSSDSDSDSSSGCGSSDSSSDSSDCGSCDSSSDSGGGDCGGDCGGSGGSDCGGGGGSNNCTIAPRSASSGLPFALLVTLLWALLPVPVVARLRRREARRARAAAIPPPPADSDSAEAAPEVTP
jgi:hypothetical protein